jgi:hypothetical protein
MMISKQQMIVPKSLLAQLLESENTSQAIFDLH